MLRACLLACLFVSSSSLTVQAEEEADPRFAVLAESLTGATLVGHYTEGGSNPPLNEERYELKQVRHVEGNMWLFACRIRYGDHDLTLPLTLPVLWAGDTPVITLDKLPVPGLGTFTARVLIYDDHYVGFWKGDGHGGHLFGRVERPADSGE